MNTLFEDIGEDFQLQEWISLAKKFGVFDLTPIEKYRNILYKRDDLYIPFKDSYINGGKVRQLISIVLKNKERILKYHNGGIITGCGVMSPQSVIATRIANEFGIKTIVCTGGNERTVDKYPALRNAKDMGANIRVVSKLGYSGPINKKIDEITKDNKYFKFKIGFLLDDEESLIYSLYSTASQVKNLPDNINHLVIPVGSAFSFAGIYLGIKIFGKHIDNIYAVCVGRDRTKLINKILSNVGIYDPSYVTINHFAEVPYHKKLKFREPFEIDDIYESKAVDWMNKYLHSDGTKLLWIVGNGNMFR